MPSANVDNFKKNERKCEKNEFPKIAGYKINLPFVAGTQHVRLTILIRCSIMKLQVKNIRKKKKDSPSLTPKRRKMK